MNCSKDDFKSAVLVVIAFSPLLDSIQISEIRAIASRQTLLAKHLNLDGPSIIALNVHGQVIKVVDQLFKILRLDLRKR